MDFTDEMLIEYDENEKAYLNFCMFLYDEEYMDFGKRSGCFEQANINSEEEMTEPNSVNCYCDILKGDDGNLRARVTMVVSTDEKYISEEVPLSEEEQELLIKTAREYVWHFEGKNVTLESLIESVDSKYEPPKENKKRSEYER